MLVPHKSQAAIFCNLLPMDNKNKIIMFLINCLLYPIKCFILVQGIKIVPKRLEVWRSRRSYAKSAADIDMEACVSVFVYLCVKSVIQFAVLT